MKGLIIYNDYWSSTNMDYCIDMLMNEAYKRGIDISKTSSNQAIFNMYGTCQYDFVIMRDKTPLIAKQLEMNGVRVFNASKCIRICDDKAEMYITLTSKGIPMPLSFISPQTYGGTIGEKFLINIGRQLGFPMIIKDPHSSLGEGVIKIDRQERLLQYSKHTKPLLFQKFIATHPPYDIRVFVIGDKAIGAMKRIASEGEFRSNMELGGNAEPYHMSKEIAQLAVNASQSLGLAYAGVDIMKGSEGFLVIEVNANACFRAFDEILDTSIAYHIIDYIKEKIDD